MVDPSARAAAPTDEELLARARAALEHAWSPYSGVRVGAALLAEDGRVFSGCNVENASLGLTLCAERTALVKAVSEGARSFRAIAIATDRPHGWQPCGACRQVLSEFAPSLRVLVRGEADRMRETSLAELLPGSIGPQDLGAPATPAAARARAAAGAEPGGGKGPAPRHGAEPERP